MPLREELLGLETVLEAKVTFIVEPCQMRYYIGEVLHGVASLVSVFDSGSTRSEFSTCCVKGLVSTLIIV